MKRVRTKCALSSNRKRGTIDSMNSAKQKYEQNEESYERKHQNLDTKDRYLEKERKVVRKRKIEKQ
jgi:hypothetical protein